MAKSRVKITKKRQMRGQEYLVLSKASNKKSIGYLEKRYKGDFRLISGKSVIVRKAKKAKKKR